MSQHNFQPTDDGSHDNITPTEHEWTTPSEMTFVERNEDSLDAARGAASSSKREAGDLPAAVDMNNTRRMQPLGPREYGAVGTGKFHPSPTLDPRHAELLDGYEDFQEDLGPVQRCLANAYTGLIAIDAAREKLRNDPTVTAGAAVVRLVAEAERKHNHIVDTFARTEERLRNTERTLEKSLSTPVEQNAGLGTVNDAIRAHAKGLDSGKRHKFMEDAFKEGDQKTLVAICGAPHYLSGLEKAAHDLYVRRLHEMRDPTTTRRLKSVRAAIALIERAVPIAMTSVEKALGSSFAKAKQLKATSDASDAALKAIMGPPSE
jgi:hypothetical protein